MMELESFLPEILVVLFVVNVLITIYLILNWCSKCGNKKQVCTYGYGDHDGPHTWKSLFKIRGDNQSPINIISVCAIVVPEETATPLDFTAEYHTTPQDMIIVNDGHTVVIYSTWANERKPILCGGPLGGDEYKLFSMRFRWGPNDGEGSEHTIDMIRYSMELQVTYNKRTCKCTDISKSARTCAVVIISYVFEVSGIDNPFLETMINSFKYIQRPCKSHHMRPLPVSLLAPTFTRNYFTYLGSLTYPPCTEGVRWIIQPEPLNVSSHQLRQFRNLDGNNGAILRNTRPVQNSNNRDVLLYV